MREREYERPVKQPKPIHYEFAVLNSGKVPVIHGSNFRLGDIVSAESGTYKVIEVFQRSETKVRVLLRRVEAKVAPVAPKPPKVAKKRG